MKKRNLLAIVFAVIALFCFADSGGANETHAFLYSGGVMTDLGTLGGTYSMTQSSQGINNLGQIVGEAELGNGGSGVVPIPSAVLLLGSGLVRLAAYRRKLKKG